MRLGDYLYEILEKLNQTPWNKAISEDRSIDTVTGKQKTRKFYRIQFSINIQNKCNKSWHLGFWLQHILEMGTLKLTQSKNTYTICLDSNISEIHVRFDKNMSIHMRLRNNTSIWEAEKTEHDPEFSRKLAKTINAYFTDLLSDQNFRKFNTTNKNLLLRLSSKNIYKISDVDDYNILKFCAEHLHLVKEKEDCLSKLIFSETSERDTITFLNPYDYSSYHNWIGCSQTGDILFFRNPETTKWSLIIMLNVAGISRTHITYDILDNSDVETELRTLNPHHDQSVNISNLRSILQKHKFKLYDPPAYITFREIDPSYFIAGEEKVIDHFRQQLIKELLIGTIPTKKQIRDNLHSFDFFKQLDPNLINIIIDYIDNSPLERSNKTETCLNVKPCIIS